MYFAKDADLQSILRAYGIDNLDLRGSSDENCTHPSILEFPNFMREKSVLNCILCLLMTCYMFLFLAVVCDVYLIPATERLCYALRITYDVAAATLLASATSAPELFINCIGTFITHGDIGVGTIVGSSVFNVLVIAWICGVFSGVENVLDYWPITRDTFWYLTAIFQLFISLIDSKVTGIEGTLMVVTYFIYVLTLIFDQQIQHLCRADLDLELQKIQVDPLEREEEPLLSFKEQLCSFPKREQTCWQRFCAVMQYPTNLILCLTTPSVRGIYMLTLLVSILWIMVVSYLITWFLTVAGYIMNIPDSIMGLTIIAAGTSVPEMATSLIVSKKGLGSMAMCNAIASNTFDILGCLGIPWMANNIIYSIPVEINSEAMTISAGILVFTAVVTYGCILCSRFKLGKCVGWTCGITYLIFIGISVYVEILLLKPVCPIED